MLPDIEPRSHTSVSLSPHILRIRLHRVTGHMMCITDMHFKITKKNLKFYSVTHIIIASFVRVVVEVTDCASNSQPSENLDY